MSCTKECVYCDENCILKEEHNDVCRCLAHMHMTNEQFKKPKVTITVKVGEVEISETRPMLAEIPHDNEENAARLADQMVRAAIRRHYEK